MQNPASWRDLLRQVIQDPGERQRLAAELDVNPITLTRWMNQTSGARPRNLLKLLRALPQHRDVLLELFEAEYGYSFAELDEPALPADLDGISGVFYRRALRTYATISPSSRFSALGNLVLEQAIKHLDPQRLGMAIIVASCLPPAHGHEVRSLREILGRGTPPWKPRLEQEAVLLGAESLTGYAVGTGRVAVRQRLSESSGEEEFSLVPASRGPWEKSAMVAPIMREGKIGGGLLVSSTQFDYFTPFLQQVVESYADLLALAFGSEAFYEPAHISLRIVPPQSVQRPYLARFSHRLTEILRLAGKDQRSLGLPQAEQLVWQQFEELFFDLSLAEAGSESRLSSQPTWKE